MNKDILPRLFQILAPEGAVGEDFEFGVVELDASKLCEVHVVEPNVTFPEVHVVDVS